MYIVPKNCYLPLVCGITGSHGKKGLGTPLSYIQYNKPSYMTEIEKRRAKIEMKRILHFGKIVGPWWRNSITHNDLIHRFTSFLQLQDNEHDPILRAAFTCMLFDNNRLLAFVPHNGPPFGLLRSDRVALSESEAAVASLVDETYKRPTMPFFSDHFQLPDSLRPKTIGKMMVWCIEDTDPHHQRVASGGALSSARVGSGKK